MQGHTTKVENPKGLLIRFPRPFWSVLGRPKPPLQTWDFVSKDYAPVSAKDCGCILVRQLKRTAKLKREQKEYKCSVCEKQGGKNGQEKSLLKQVECVVGSRPDRFLLCCQFPIGQQPGKPRLLRCDILIVPVLAKHTHHMIVVELDGDDHGHKPRQYGRDASDGYSATVDSDNEKRDAVLAHGMQFLRASVSDADKAWVWE